jgi:formylglycine-generating enzyme required for sulfatase activity
MEKSLFAHITGARNALFDWCFEIIIKPARQVKNLKKQTKISLLFMTDKLQSILQAEGLDHLLPIFTDQGVTDSILGDLSADDLRDLGIDKLGERKRLLAAFLAISAESVALSIASEDVISESVGAPSPAAATKDIPFVNGLGQPFVPIPRFDTRFCIWPVRVQDYEVFCTESGAKFPECPFAQDSDHPIVGVSWNDAIEFCIWLTAKERASGIIDEKMVYRLPTDLEWSAAVGLPHEPEPTPAERHLKAPGYPWGLRWPPPKNAGNYEPKRNDQVGYLETSQFIPRWLDEHAYLDDPWRRMKNEVCLSFKSVYNQWLSDWQIEVDSFDHTSPVGSFTTNLNGISDLGGNVWEWCMDDWSPDCKLKILRGASYAHHHFSKDIDPQGSIMKVGFFYEDKSQSYVFHSSDIMIPIANKLLYQSSCRFATSPEVTVETRLGCDMKHGDIWLCVMEQRGNPYPISGFRTVLHTLP